jgi:hypothetical protein
MTSESRAYAIIIGGTVAGVCLFGQSVEHWTLRAAFGIAGAAATAFLNGLAKSPRDGALSDQAAPPVVAVDVKTDTTATTVTHAEAPKE